RQHAFLAPSGFYASLLVCTVTESPGGTGTDLSIVCTACSTRDSFCTCVSFSCAAFFFTCRSPRARVFSSPRCGSARLLASKFECNSETFEGGRGAFGVRMGVL
ncbi:hypothetical protein C8R44DRAFT_826772, partial [Mycena epipterygia]